MDLSTKTVFISRDVHFHENIFPFATDVKDFSDPFFTEVDASASSTNMDTFVTPVSIPDTQSDSFGACNPLNQPSSSLSTPSDSPNHSSFPSNPSDLLKTYVSTPTISNADPPPTKKSTRTHKAPTYLQDYACNSATMSPTSIASHASGSPYDIAECLTYSHLELEYHSYLMAVSHSHQAP